MGSLDSWRVRWESLSLSRVDGREGDERASLRRRLEAGMERSSW